MNIERVFSSNDKDLKGIIQSYFLEKIDTMIIQDYDHDKVNTATSPKEEIQ
ncbi:hypothetical protein [Halobacillus litoralis]|uniref:hypothetical protein n=1 Tax=Halobacillus litoralis TaxID=45668 RepID=UPI001CD577DC|nr:hypothetical protein [Halobacillus litoralis]MCA1022128.1 hypothetical protein [Halobacillus litoralis]